MSLKNETVRCPACGKDVWPCQELDEKGTVIDRCPTEGCRAVLTEQMGDKHREGVSELVAPVADASGQVVGSTGPLVTLGTMLQALQRLESRVAAQESAPRGYGLRPPEPLVPVAEPAAPTDLDAGGIAEMAKRRLRTIGAELKRMGNLMDEARRLENIVAAYSKPPPAIAKPQPDANA